MGVEGLGQMTHFYGSEGPVHPIAILWRHTTMLCSPSPRFPSSSPNSVSSFPQAQAVAGVRRRRILDDAARKAAAEKAEADKVPWYPMLVTLAASASHMLP